jgi:hypothetical protein
MLEKEETEPARMDMMAPEQVLGVWNGEWATEETTGREELDSILTGDPLDIFQWDEWESLTSEFFAS